MADKTAPPPALAVSTREVELKLHAEPQHLIMLAGHPVLQAMAAGPAVVWRQTTTYYDTPDLLLAARGVALRVRVQDDECITQAVKTLNSIAAGDSAAVAVRREWVWLLNDDNPNLAVLNAPGVNQMVPPEALNNLHPIFATEIRRTGVTVRIDAQTAIDVAFDVGVVRAGARLHPISEIELELRSGKVGPLFDLALQLQEIVPLRIAGESKAEAGYRLVTGKLPEPVQSEPVALSPATTVAEAFRHVVRHCLRQLLQNEDCALMALSPAYNGTADNGAGMLAIRHIRHALRRLRHCLTLYQPMIASPTAPDFADQCRVLERRLRPARDWSVVAQVLHQAGLDPVDNASIRIAAAAARAAILAPEFTRLVLSAGGWLEQERWCERAKETLLAQVTQPIADYAAPWLDQMYKRTRKIDYAKMRSQEMRQLHRSLRRLHDAAESFRGLYPPTQSRPFMAMLTELRHALDVVNDLRMTRDLLHDAEGRHETARDALLERLQAEGLANLAPSWHRFKTAEPFWRRK
ncbi:MAG: CHAD domain-containing protein [Rhodospirillaceae bacterium]